jgi:hypothetical protein
MDRKILAGEILAIARDLVGMEFPTQDALDKYLKDHPDADRGKHRVVKTKTKVPAKKEKAELPQREDVENAFRDHLSGKGRKVTKESMKAVMKGQFKGLTDVGFDNVWNSLVKEEYLVPAEGGGYEWEM